MDRKSDKRSLQMPSLEQMMRKQENYLDLKEDVCTAGLKKLGYFVSGSDVRTVKPKVGQDGQTRHSCGSCHQEFDSRLALSIHVGRVHKESGGGSSSSTRAGCGGDVEVAATANRRTHVCHLCDKAFYSSSYLSQHLRIHSGLKPYGCQVCSRRFTQLSHLQQHRRTHTGEKPYKCKHSGCTKAFSQLSNLQSHSRSHMTDRTYKCTSCYKCFLDKDSLLSHVSTHLGTRRVRAFACHLCDKSYTQDTYLQNHIKVKHATAHSNSNKVKASRERLTDAVPTMCSMEHNEHRLHAELPYRQMTPSVADSASSESLLLAGLGVGASDVRHHQGLHNAQQSSAGNGKDCCGVPVSVICSTTPAVVTPMAAMLTEQTRAPSGMGLANSPMVATTMSSLATGPQDVLLSSASAKGQAVAVVPPTIHGQVGNRRKSSITRAASHEVSTALGAAGDTCKGDPGWQWLGVPTSVDNGNNYFSSYVHPDLHALQMSLSQHEPFRWPSCAGEMDQRPGPFGSGGGRILMNPQVVPPYWLCGDSAYKHNGSIGRGLFGSNTGGFLDSMGSAVSSYGFGMTQGGAFSGDQYVHPDAALLLQKAGPAHPGFSGVAFPGL